MKRLFIIPLLLLVVTACNNITDHTDHTKQAAPKTETDSLEAAIDEGHLVGMSKMGKLTRLQQRASQMVDSIEKLPAKAKLAAAPLKAKLQELAKQLDYADFAMTKWMNEYRMDSAVNDAKQRLNYLLEEKDKVAKVKSAILTGIDKADSLFKSLTH